MIDIAPTLALVTRRHSPDRGALRIWFLVLASRRILARIDGPRLLVSPALAVRAAAEIAAYEGENLPRPELAPLPDNVWVSLGVVGLFTALIALGAAQPGTLQSWLQYGQADAGAIVQGQWWRCVTALFLHADAGHLLANAAGLGVIASILGRRIGSGLTWGLFLGTGAVGNLCNAYVHSPGHLSIGASTGLFGLIGVMAGSAGRSVQGKRGMALFAPLGFALSFLALLGAGEEQVDLGAHLFGLLCGLGPGLLLGAWRGALGWKRWLNGAAGATALLLGAWAWHLALPMP